MKDKLKMCYAHHYRRITELLVVKS